MRQDLATRIGAIATQLRGLQLTADAATLRDQVSTNLGTLATTVATASPDPATVAQAAQLVRQLQQKVCV